MGILIGLLKITETDCKHKYRVIDVIEKKFKNTGHDLQHYVIKCKRCNNKREVTWTVYKTMKEEGILK
jgi:hypothetical protein